MRQTQGDFFTEADSPAFPGSIVFYKRQKVGDLARAASVANPPRESVNKTRVCDRREFPGQRPRATPEDQLEDESRDELQHNEGELSRAGGAVIARPR